MVFLHDDGIQRSCITQVRSRLRGSEDRTTGPHGHLCSIATHDRSIQEDLASLITQRGIDPRYYEFESLIGLGTDQSDALRRRGFPTRKYAVFGEEYFLYVLNRIAEEPIRLFQALIDVVGADN
jgi:proline dehydrogenase